MTTFNIGMDLEVDYRRFSKLLLLKPSLRRFEHPGIVRLSGCFLVVKQSVEHHMGAPRQDMQSDAQVYSVSFSK